jgi:hypothetical protein
MTLKSTPTTATADVRLRQLLDEYSNNAPAYILSRFSVTHMTSITVRMGEQSQLLYLKLQDMPISKQEIRRLVSDRVLSQEIAYRERGWPSNNSILEKTLHTYYKKRTEVELDLRESMLLWRGQIVMLQLLRETILHVMHEGHPGVSSMRELAKFY